MKFQALFFVLTLFFCGKSFGQGSTFSITVNDTLLLYSQSSRPVRVSSENYIVASSGAGSGLNGTDLCYQRLLSIDDAGVVLFKKVNYSLHEKCIGSPQLIKTSDGNLILGSVVSQNTSPDQGRVIIRKINFAITDTIWTYYHSDSLYTDVVKDILEDENGFIVVVGYRIYSDSLNNDKDVFLLKLTNTGQLVFFRTYDEGRTDHGNSVCIIAGGYLIGGASNSHSVSDEGYILRTDTDGNRLWSEFYPQIAYGNVYEMSNDNYIISGSIFTSVAIPTLIEIDDLGNEINYHNLINTYSTEAYVAREISGQNLITVGATHDGSYIEKTDLHGNSVWHRRIQYNSTDEYFIDFIETDDYGLLISGAVNDFLNGGQNLWIVKLDSMGCLEPNCWVGLEGVEPNTLGVSIFPNPANEWLNFKLQNTTSAVTLELFSIAGQRVMNTKLSAPLEAIQVSHLPVGLYLAKFTLKDGKSVTERVVIAR